MVFRNMVETQPLAEVEHDPSDFIWLRQVFGLENGEPAIQYPGSTRANVGRVVMYPSTIEHKFTRFELKDRSKSGYTRAIVFFLVDPNIRIISTANIAPQRVDWTKDIPPGMGVKEGLQKLALDNIDEKGDMPMSLREALDMRLEVLEDVAEFTRYQHVAFESNVLML